MNKRIVLIIVICVLVLAGVLAVFKARKPAGPQVSSLANAKEAKPKSVQQLLDLAKTQEVNNELSSARELYSEVLNNHPDYSRIQDVQKKIEDLNMKIIFSPTLITSSAKVYEVKPGDSLAKIAQQFSTTVELIKKINMLKSEVIRPKMQLKIWTGKFSVLVDKSQNILMLKSGTDVVKTYVVATGRNNSTPVGTFKIVNKLIDPPWFKPGANRAIPAQDPENILGSRWMGFDLPSYGIHGTTQPEALGTQATDGCVRMRNEEVEELYSLFPVGIEVTIVD